METDYVKTAAILLGITFLSAGVLGGLFTVVLEKLRERSGRQLVSQKTEKLVQMGTAALFVLSFIPFALLLWASSWDHRYSGLTKEFRENRQQFFKKPQALRKDVTPYKSGRLLVVEEDYPTNFFLNHEMVLKIPESERAWKLS